MPKQSSEGPGMAANAEAALTPQNIAATLREFQVDIAGPLAGQIADYVRLLVRWNQKVSLTTITAPREILTRHFGESLFGAQVAGIRAGRLLDVGSGAGFPAMPIAMLAPGIRETLLEPNVKKAAFLAEACRHLGLVNRVQVVRARLEEFPAPEQLFDFITSRAVRVTPDFLKKCRQMLLPGGTLVLWIAEEEMASLQENRDWSWSEPARIPGSEHSYIFWGQPATE
jgi:16S rRNA (guanine527-N7)-methyltransferase